MRKNTIKIDMIMKYLKRERVRVVPWESEQLAGQAHVHPPPPLNTH